MTWDIEGVIGNYFVLVPHAVINVVYIHGHIHGCVIVMVTSFMVVSCKFDLNNRNEKKNDKKEGKRL